METFNPKFPLDLIPEPAGRVYGDITNTDGLPGQNSPTPSQKLFAFHAILEYGTMTHPIKYYDPSYGVTYGSEQAFQAAAVQAIATYDRTEPTSHVFTLALPVAGDVEFKNSRPGQ